MFQFGHKILLGRYLILRKHIPLLLLSALALFGSIFLCGCSKNSSDDEPTDESYNMISDGTSVHISNYDDQEREEAVYIPDGMVTQYASRYLDSEQLGIYNSLVKSVANCESSVPMTADSDIYNTLLNLVGIEQLGFGHVSNRKMGDFDVETQHFSIEYTYRFTAAEMSNMNRASEAAADKILEGITDDMSDYDKLKYFHDYLIKNCKSDTEDKFANTIYGTLVNGKALCEGYAKSFSYLCNRAGIENMIVTGMTNVAHMWNMVKVDGNWYHIDVTWDKPEGPLEELYPDMVMYQFFMVTDSVIENDHVIWTVGYEPPHAYSTKENYFFKENLYISSEDETDSVVEKAFAKAVSQRSSTATIKFDSNNLMLSTIRNMKNSAENGGDYLKSSIEKVSLEYNVKLNVSWTDYYSPYRILVFVIDYVE